MAPYVIGELNLIKGAGQYSEFIGAMGDLETQLFQEASAKWEGWTPGGLTPGDNQYGVTTLRKNDMANDTTDSVPSGSYSFIKTFSTTGWQDLFNYRVRDKMFHGFAGFNFANDVLRIQQLRIQISDRIFPIIDISQAQMFGGFSVVFKTDELKHLIASPTNRVIIRGYVESTGVQNVIPIGINLYQDKNLVLEET